MDKFAHIEKMDGVNVHIRGWCWKLFGREIYWMKFSDGAYQMAITPKRRKVATHGSKEKKET